MHRHRSAISVFLILLTLPLCQYRPVLSHDLPLSRPHNIILFIGDSMERPFAPTLADMTAKALAILGKDPDGFFPLVEGGGPS